MEDGLQRRVEQDLAEMRDRDSPWEYWRLLAKIKDPRRDRRIVLTPTELRAINHASHGLTSNEAAEVAGVSTSTMREQLKSARARLAAKTVAQACSIALRQGLIS